MIGILKYHQKNSELQIYSHTEIASYRENKDGLELKTSTGYIIHCKYLIIAAGFEAGKFLPGRVMELNSTYALVSQPVNPELLWPERSLIWETRHPYFYLRTTGDNRMMIGVGDEEFRDPVKRDSLLRNQTRKLERQFSRLYPGIPFITDMAWYI